jgi:hypothetical protein
VSRALDCKRTAACITLIAATGIQLGQISTLFSGLPIDVNQAQRASQILGPALLKGLVSLWCSATMQDTLWCSISCTLKITTLVTVFVGDNIQQATRIPLKIFVHGTLNSEMVHVIQINPQLRRIVIHQA